MRERKMIQQWLEWPWNSEKALLGQGQIGFVCKPEKITK